MLIYRLPVFRVCDLQTGRAFCFCHLCILPCDPARMQDHRFAVDQVVDTGSLSLCTVCFCRHKSYRIPVSERDRTISKQIRRIHAAGRRTAIINDHPFPLIGAERHIVGRLHGLDQVLLFQICLRRTVHTDTGKLCLRIPKHLFCVDKRRAAPVCRRAALPGNIQQIRRQSGFCRRLILISCGDCSKNAFQQRDKLLLHVARPESCHKGTDRRHRVRARQRCGQIRRTPHLRPADDRCHVLIGCDLVVFQIRTFDHLLGFPCQILEERHVYGRRRLRRQRVKFCVVGNDAALYQCGNLHCPVNHIRVKKLGDDNVL